MSAVAVKRVTFSATDQVISFSTDGLKRKQRIHPNSIRILIGNPIPTEKAELLLKKKKVTQIFERPTSPLTVKDS